MKSYGQSLTTKQLENRADSWKYRYTITYTPSHDRILPTSSNLYVKIKNTSAIALRAAYLHGPYTLYAACYPSVFDPNKKHDSPTVYGQPQFEPNLKAGGSWNAQLTIPEDIRETIAQVNTRNADEASPSVTWILEVTSQVLFSATAAVHFEVIVGRDEKSIEFGFAGLTGVPHSSPGQLVDHQESRRRRGQGAAQPKGVYSKAVTVVVDDTASLWNKPQLPAWDDDDYEGESQNPALAQTDPALAKPEQGPNETHDFHGPSKAKGRRRKKVHLVIITHGLHSNLGADMLYLKESIDAAAKTARLDAKMRKAKAKSEKPKEAGQSSMASVSSNVVGSTNGSASGGPTSGGQEELDSNDDDSDDEDVIVRGFSGNAARTERGIQYLGKRLAKYVLSVTYPDQPYLPIKKSAGTVSKSVSRVFGNHDGASDSTERQPSHANSSIRKEEVSTSNLAYKITSISFIGHSLGGLTQTYAVAYIHKHSPEFFDLIKPINFVALASPFLGLSNENPLYVKFALDFGLVGRTGQDLGLTWRAPTMVRSGWGALIAGIGTEGQRKHRQLDPGSKPLLRILPSGPAHHVLRLFRNRTVYSNVVNDGIVPLRTSCLLFLDWRGLGRVEKARRENGLVGTMAGWGWAELTGTNATEQQRSFGRGWFDHDTSGDVSMDEGNSTPTKHDDKDKVPQPAKNATQDDDGVAEPDSPQARQFLSQHARHPEDEEVEALKSSPPTPSERPSSPLAGFLSFFNPISKSHSHDQKQTRIYKRSQTIKASNVDDTAEQSLDIDGTSQERPSLVRGDTAFEDPNNVYAPPKTSLFEAAGDVLNPPIPTKEFLNDPTSRPRTIFHDRVYHPTDIPSPPVKQRSTLRRNKSSDGREGRSSTISSMMSTSSSNSSVTVIDTSGMKVEEKIARAYHRDLSWRKVLVRLEPDAHNNIIVRRMFSNAYGWPVVKHLVDTHFGDTYAAKTADKNELNTERAKPIDEAVGEHGEEVRERPRPRRASLDSERREASDNVTALGDVSSSVHSTAQKPNIRRMDSAQWDDRFFVSEDEDEDDYDFEPQRSPVPRPVRESKAPQLPKLEGSGRPIVMPDLTQSPPPASRLGLGKSVKEQIDGAIGK